MTKSRTPVLIVLAVVLAALIIIFILGLSPERIAKPADAMETPVAGGPAPNETKTVTLFFLREDDGLFLPEERKIPVAGSIAREAESVLLELIKGSTNGLPSALPPETKILQVFLTKDGTAYADFSKDLAAAHPSGADAETSTVYVIVDSLAYNFKTIKKVVILIDGEERETLNGHITLDRALVPNYTLIAKTP
jgi:germination protein M